MALSFRIDQTPNPNAIKVTLTKKIFEGDKSYTFKKDDNPDNPIVASLLTIDGIDNVFGYQDFITINKKFDVDWEILLPKIEEVFNNANPS